MENIQTTHLLQLVHLDYLTIKMTDGGKDSHILIIMDHVMQYMQALLMSSQTAKCTVQALWDQFIVHHGLPESIVSDQGLNFKSDLNSEQCKLAKVQKLHTNPYIYKQIRPYECYNHNLINMLGTLPPNKKSSWRDMVPMLVHAHNCTKSRATGFSPYYLMYGQKYQHPIDLLHECHHQC